MLRRTVHLAVALIVATVSCLAAVGQEFVRGHGGSERRARVVLLRAAPAASIVAGRVKDAGLRRLPGLPAFGTFWSLALAATAGEIVTTGDASPVRRARNAVAARAPPLA